MKNLEIIKLARRANEADRKLLEARYDVLNNNGLIHGPHKETTDVVMVEDATEIPFGYRVSRKDE